MTARHKWSDPHRTEYRTERTCIKCGITKTTRHDGDGFPWIEFYRDDHRIVTDNNRTPECEQQQEQKP
jgi:hypothetical protein